MSQKVRIDGVKHVGASVFPWSGPLRQSLLDP